MGSCCCCAATPEASTPLVAGEPEVGSQLVATYAQGRCLAKVVEVYDGCTVRVLFVWREHVIQRNARMVGYRCPSMRLPMMGKGSPATRARDALLGKIDNSLVYIECLGANAEGQLLITMHLREPPRTGENVNLWMVTQGYGLEDPASQC
jgi:hypothetical protein